MPLLLPRYVVYWILCNLLRKKHDRANLGEERMAPMGLHKPATEVLSTHAHTNIGRFGTVDRLQGGGTPCNAPRFLPCLVSSFSIDCMWWVHLYDYSIITVWAGCTKFHNRDLVSGIVQSRFTRVPHPHEKQFIVRRLSVFVADIGPQVCNEARITSHHRMLTMISNVLVVSPIFACCIDEGVGLHAANPPDHGSDERELRTFRRLGRDQSWSCGSLKESYC